MLAGDDAAELAEIDVATGNDANDFAGAAFSGKRAGYGAGARAFSDHAIAFREQAHRGGDVWERADQRPVDQRASAFEHLRKDTLAANTVDERRLVLNHLRRSGGERSR